MKEEILKQIEEIIQQWKQRKEHTYELKNCWAVPNPSMKEELLLYFSNRLYSFFCQGKLIPIELVSHPFITGTLSPNPISDNFKADLTRLSRFLEDFDKQFYDLIQKKIEECVDKLETSDIMRWL